MALEECLEKGLFLPLLAKGCQPETGLVSLLLPRFAKVCKILQLPTLEFGRLPLSKASFHLFSLKHHIRQNHRQLATSIIEDAQVPNQAIQCNFHVL